VTSAPAPRAFDVRHVQLARAAFAGIAAVMITFSPDHSAAVGAAVFSGFAIATALVLLLSVWLVYPKGLRWPAAALGAVTLVAGMVAGLAPLRTVTGFFTTVIVWALVSGLIELIAGWQGLRGARTRRQIVPGVDDARPPSPLVPRSEARDAVVVGVVTIVLGIALLFVSPRFSLDYTIDDANATFTLTGIIIGVGVFGGYAAIVAVYLAIAGFSPRGAAEPADVSAVDPADVPAAVTSAEQPTDVPAGQPADEKDPA